MYQKSFFTRVKVLSVLVFLVTILAGACAPIPKVEFTAYREAFREARSASEILLVDYAAKSAAADQLEGIADEDGDGDGLFDPESIAANGNVDSVIQSRIEAWNTIARYNDVLLALAEGKSVDEVASGFNKLTSGIKTVASSFGAAIPGLSIAGDIVSKFLELAEKARLREEFATAIKEGEPIIGMIITEVLIKDTRVFDGIREILADDAINKALSELLKNSRAMARLAAEHDNPPEGSQLVQAKQKTANRLGEILEAFKTDELNVPKSKVPITTDVTTSPPTKDTTTVGDLSTKKTINPAPTPYTELVQTQLDQLLSAAEAANSLRQQQLDDRQAYHQALKSYVLLLRKMKSSLELVRTQLDAPVDLTAAATEIIGLAISLRSDFAKFKEF